MDLVSTRMICNRLSYLKRLYDTADTDERALIRSLVFSIFDEIDRNFCAKEDNNDL